MTVRLIIITLVFGFSHALAEAPSDDEISSADKFKLIVKKKWTTDGFRNNSETTWRAALTWEERGTFIGAMSAAF